MRDRGLHYKRQATNPREKAFAEMWKQDNDPEYNRFINHGFGTLQDLFIRGNPFGVGNLVNRRRVVHKITNRERFIVATVIQWLGTNCGMAFLREVLHRCGYMIVERDKAI